MLLEFSCLESYGLVDLAYFQCTRWRVRDDKNVCVGRLRAGASNCFPHFRSIVAPRTNVGCKMRVPVLHTYCEGKLCLSLSLPSQHPFGCLAGLDSRACVPRTSHVIVRMDRECFACFLGCGTLFMGKGSLALVPKSLSVHRFTGMTLLPRF